MNTKDTPTMESVPAVMTIARLMGLTERYRRELERVHDMPKAEMRLLWLFADGNPRTLKTISDELSLEQSTVNRQVGAAEARGHLRRIRAEGEAALLIEATEAGNAAFTRSAEANLRAIGGGIAALGDEAATFEALFERFVAGFGEATEAVVEAAES